MKMVKYCLSALKTVEVLLLGSVGENEILRRPVSLSSVREYFKLMNLCFNEYSFT